MAGYDENCHEDIPEVFGDLQRNAAELNLFELQINNLLNLSFFPLGNILTK